MLVCIKVHKCFPMIDETFFAAGTPLTMNIGTTSVVGPEKADEVFIAWLKSMRENNYSITLPKVKEKVAELFQTFGTTNIEKTCKWFLLWNNR